MNYRKPCLPGFAVGPDEKAPNQCHATALIYVTERAHHPSLSTRQGIAEHFIHSREMLRFNFAEIARGGVGEVGVLAQQLHQAATRIGARTVS